KDVSAPKMRSFKLLASNVENASGHKYLMDGVSLPPGGPARRTIQPGQEVSPAIEKAIRQRVQLQAISETPIKGVSDPEKLLALIGPMLDGMPDDMGANAAYGVAMQFVHQGQWHLAREAFLLMVDRYPAHPQSVEAYRWLMKHNASSEVRRRHELGQFLVVQAIRGVSQESPPTALPESLKPMAKDQKGPGHVAVPQVLTPKGDTQVVMFTTKSETRQWYQGCLEMEPRLLAYGPLVSNDPQIQFCLNASRRNLGDMETPLRWYREFASRQPE